MSSQTTVWIVEGCLPCNACEGALPEVFHIPDDLGEAVIRGDVRNDGISDRNDDRRSPLHITIAEQFGDELIEAVEGCPVDVIKFTME